MVLIQGSRVLLRSSVCRDAQEERQEKTESGSGMTHTAIEYHQGWLAATKPGAKA